EALPAGDQFRIAVGVVARLDLAEDDVAIDVGRVGPGGVAAAVAGVTDRGPAGPVVLGLLHQAARLRRLQHPAAVVEPARAGQAGGGDGAGGLVHQVDVGAEGPALVVVLAGAPRPQQAGRRLIGHAVVVGVAQGHAVAVVLFLGHRLPEVV